MAEPKTEEQLNFLASLAYVEEMATGVQGWWVGLADLGHEGEWVWQVIFCIFKNPILHNVGVAGHLLHRVLHLGNIAMFSEHSGKISTVQVDREDADISDWDSGCPDMSEHNSRDCAALISISVKVRHLK